MKKLNSGRPASLKIIFTLLGLAVLLAISLFALMQGNANAASTRLDEKTLEKKALAEAKQMGLHGAPIAKRSVQMTLAEWLKLVDAGLGTDAAAPTAVGPINARAKPTLIDAGLGKSTARFGFTPDMPVYVLAMRGEVISRIPESPRPEKTGPNRYDHITIVLDAKTGKLLWVMAGPASSPMPIEVPLLSYP